MAKKVLLYVGAGLLCIAMILGFFVLANGIKYAVNNGTYQNGSAIERVDAAEKKTEAQKALSDLSIYTGASIVVSGGLLIASVAKKPIKKRR